MVVTHTATIGGFRITRGIIMLSVSGGVQLEYEPDPGLRHARRTRSAIAATPSDATVVAHASPLLRSDPHVRAATASDDIELVRLLLPAGVPAWMEGH